MNSAFTGQVGIGRDNLLVSRNDRGDSHSVRISENGTSMLLLSAVEDFVTRSLAAVPGKLGKLIYLSSLRKSGQYFHWGLIRSHGSSSATKAMEETHTSVWLEVLRTPLPQLNIEVQTWTENGKSNERKKKWLANMSGLMPENRAGGTQRHFSSILLALSQLSRAQSKKNDRPSA
jgi:hypothetical protein